MRMPKTILWTVLALLAVPVTGYAVSPAMKELEDDFAALAERIRPMVVNIDTRGTLPQPEEMRGFEDLFRFFGLPTPEGPEGMPRPRRQRLAQGSGFIYDKQGHIITNNHMVENTETIKVRLWNGKEYDAEVVGRDPDTDLAVIKIEPVEDLPVAVLADSDALRVGQFTIAVGSPRGFEGSFSFGHISALRREELNLPGLRFQNFIQTDAAINLGNSGGPLCNSNGEVIGINIAIVYGANSLGFAIPVNTAKQIVPQLISQGKITRGFLGVGITSVRPYAEGLGLSDEQGAFVKTVQPGSPAEKAGIVPYDVIRSVNGQQVQGPSDLVRLVSAIPPGETAKLEIWRKGKSIEIDVKVTEYTGTQVAEAAGERSAIGLHVQNITPEIAERLRIKPDITGVVITEVEDGSAAEDAGLVEGDVITEVAQQKVGNVDDFVRLTKEVAQPGKTFLVGVVHRGGQADIVPIRVPDKKK